jgi:predicted nucleic acid-binding protein
MKHFFLDTNILLDLLADRKPFSEHAEILFDWGFQKKIKLHVSAISINNIYYILRHQLTHKQCVKRIKDLTDLVSIIDVNKKIIEHSLESNFNDLEDAIQYNCAITNEKIIAIITRDIKGYKSSTLPILSPKEAINLMLADIK